MRRRSFYFEQIKQERREGKMSGRGLKKSLKNIYHLVGAQEQGLSTQVSSLVSVSRVKPSPQ